MAVSENENYLPVAFLNIFKKENITINLQSTINNESYFDNIKNYIDNLDVDFSISSKPNDSYIHDYGNDIDNNFPERELKCYKLKFSITDKKNLINFANKPKFIIEKYTPKKKIRSSSRLDSTIINPEEKYRRSGFKKTKFLEEDLRPNSININSLDDFLDFKPEDYFKLTKTINGFGFKSKNARSSLSNKSCSTIIRLRIEITVNNVKILSNPLQIIKIRIDNNYNYKKLSYKLGGTL